jgi:uncharacterized protein YecT (DUF1311 family)
MQKVLFILALISCASVHAQSLPTGCGETTQEINACVAGRLHKAESLLNKIYDLVLKELSAGNSDPDPIFNNERKRTLVVAEGDWTKFKDAQCAVEHVLVAPGTAAPAVGGQCMINLINERIRFLRRVAEQISSDSKLCRPDKANCVLPADLP